MAILRLHFDRDNPACALFFTRPAPGSKHLTVCMKPQAVSNQLQRLADRGIFDSRRNGIGTLYRIVDPCVVDRLDRGWCLLADSGRRPRT